MIKNYCPPAISLNQTYHDLIESESRNRIFVFLLVIQPPMMGLVINVKSTVKRMKGKDDNLETILSAALK